MITNIRAVRPRGYFVVAVLLTLMLLHGCGEAPRTDEESVALIQRYLQAQQAGDIQAAVALYPPPAREQWQSFLQQTVQDLGAVNDYVIESIEPNTVYSGKYYLATVRVNRHMASGEDYSSMEIVTALRKLSDDQTYIVSHKIKHH